VSSASVEHDQLAGHVRRCIAGEVQRGADDLVEARDHRRLPSGSLVPTTYDPSVLLTTAGMHPLKPYFLGQETPPHNRLTTCQKVFRTTDIENVGNTTRHLTFFEMLGNFSIGDYFKQGAVEYAWEFSLQVLELNPEDIWITVFEGDDELGLGPDDEAIAAWESVGVPRERIVLLPRSENFWQAGPTGPCGPCSELYFDRGVEFGTPDDLPGGENERFVEYWNLVFMEFNQDPVNTLVPLPAKNIDTGLGLNRMAMVLQDVPSIFETDQFKPLIDVATAHRANAAFDADIATWQAQGLIETGHPEQARDILTDVAARTPAGSPQFVEARGILGRAWKQTFFEAADKSSPQAREAIEKSLAEYKACFDAQPGGSVWAGLNLLALAVFASRNAIPTAVGIEPRAMALKLLSALDATPIRERDNFYHASRAEAYLGLDDLEAVEIHIGAYVRSDATPFFNLASTLHQFTELWQLDRQGAQGHGIIQALQAALLHGKKYGRLEMSPDQMRQALGADRPSEQQLQKILGAGGLARYDWLMKGLTSARSVGVISHAAQGRQGTGFLVRGGALIPDLGDELVVNQAPSRTVR